MTNAMGNNRVVRAWLFLRDALMGHKLFPYKYKSQQVQILGALRALATLPGQQADAQALLKARKDNRIPKPPKLAPEKRERSKRSKQPKAIKRRKLPLPVPKPATPLHAGLSTSVRKSKGGAKKGGAKKGGAKKGGKKKGGKKKGGKKKGGKKKGGKKESLPCNVIRCGSRGDTPGSERFGIKLSLRNATYRIGSE